MSQFRSRTLASAVTVLALMAVVSSEEPPARRMTSIDLAQELMNAAFPELRGESLAVRVIAHGKYDRDWTSASPVGVLLRKPDEPLEAVESSTEQAREGRLLDGFFGLIFVEGAPLLSDARFSGRHVHTAETRRVRAALEANRPKTDDEAAALLAKHGAQYGPDRREAFIRALNIERFGSPLGRIVDYDVAFWWRMVFEADETQGRREDIIDPHWLVETRSDSAGGDRIRHLMAFEPFGGRLTSLQRLESRSPAQD